MTTSFIDIECDIRIAGCGVAPPARACGSVTELKWWFKSFGYACYFASNPDQIDSESKWLKSEFWLDPLLLCSIGQK